MTNEVQNEKVFLAENGITVTNTRFVVPSQIYAMSGVSSVTFGTIHPARMLPIVLAVVGLLIGIKGNMSIWGVFLCLAPGVAWLALQKTRFSVVLSTIGGEKRALVSEDRQFIERVVGALNSSVIARG